MTDGLDYNLPTPLRAAQPQARVRMVELDCSRELFSFGSKPDKPEESFGVFLRLPTEANDKGQVAAFDRFAAHHHWIIAWACGVQLIRAGHAAVPYE
jgi:hypothetical protein